MGDTIRQNTLHHTIVEEPEDADGERDLFQLPQEVQSLLGPFHDPWGVLIPAEVLRELHSEELDVLHSLHCVATDAERSVLRLWPPEVNDHLLCLVYIKHQIILTSVNQVLYETLLVCFNLSKIIVLLAPIKLYDKSDKNTHSTVLTMCCSTCVLLHK